MRPFLAFLKTDIGRALRDPLGLFFGCLFPFILFFGFISLAHQSTGQGIAYPLGMALTIGILGDGLWGAGRRKATPGGPLPALLASLASGLILYLPVAAALLGLAHFACAMPLARNWGALCLLVSLGVCAFRSLGLTVASVASTTRQAAILILSFYLPRLLLSGAAIPAALLPVWAQTLARFLPASYLLSAFQGILFHNRNIFDNRATCLALFLSIAISLFLLVTLQPRHKLWILAVMAPFLAMGSYQAYTGEHLGQNQALYRDLQRTGTFLIRDARIFVGGGQVIEKGFVVVKDGRIAAVGEGSAPDPARLGAEVVEGAGGTLLPGLIDAHVHLGAPAGVSASPDDYDATATMRHSAAALLYSGVTAVRSVGDGLHASLALRGDIATGSRLGARVFACGPMFTAEGARGKEFIERVPEWMRNPLAGQLVRTPKTPAAARSEVDELQAAGVDCIKAVLEAGWGEAMLDDRLDLLLVRSVSEEAHARHLPLAVHTGDARDVTDAVEIGASSVESGSWRDDIPESVLAKMARQGVYLDPTLGVIEAYARYYSGNTEALDDSLAAQTVPPATLNATRDFVAQAQSADQAKAQMFADAYMQAKDNLLLAWKAGVPLAMGTDAGNPMVFPGPSLHHELKLWVEAGIPAEVALDAATLQAARLLGAGNLGAIRQGWAADLLLVDGNPLEDIAAIRRIRLVVFHGERIHLAELFQQK